MSSRINEIEYKTDKMLEEKKDKREEMKISYSLLTHNETDSLYKLIDFLVKHKDEEDEIVILDDYSDNEKTKEILDTMCSIHEIKFEQRHLLNDYGKKELS